MQPIPNVRVTQINYQSKNKIWIIIKKALINLIFFIPLRKMSIMYDLNNF